ncbi:MAG: 2-C-methyl-D-erythritol 2,4-cyclodiphosphate synthase [Desulfosalsimonadaceae bacterium]
MTAGIIQREGRRMKVGMGWDVHRLATGRPLILGGIEIPYEMGLVGHSDADVLLHAVCDALLGAAGMGDIGEHFSDDDPRFKDVSSIVLLQQVLKIVSVHQFVIGNVDATLFAQAPRLTPYKAAMRAKLAEVLSVSPGQINIKATTTEGLGYIGEGLGIAAMCIALID